MIELLSNFYLVREEDKSSSLSNIVDVYNVTYDNAQSVLHHSIKKYKDLKPVIVIYTDSDVMKYFLTMFIHQYVKVDKVGEMEDILMMNGCAVI